MQGYFFLKKLYILHFCFCSQLVLQSQTYTLSCTGYPSAVPPPTSSTGIGSAPPPTTTTGGISNNNNNLSRNSEAYVWGSNSSHQLAETDCHKFPVPLMSSMLKDVQKVRTEAGFSKKLTLS